LFRKDERDEFTTVYGCDLVSFGLCVSSIVEKSDTVLDGYIGVPAVVIVKPRLHEAGTDVVRADADADEPGCRSLIGGNSSDVDKNGNSTSFCITERCLSWSRLVGKLDTPRLSSFKCQLEFSWGKIRIYINIACHGQISRAPQFFSF